jgi:hypothetical protein
MACRAGVAEGELASDGRQSRKAVDSSGDVEQVPPRPVAQRSVESDDGPQRAVMLHSNALELDSPGPLILGREFQHGFGWCSALGRHEPRASRPKRQPCAAGVHLDASRLGDEGEAAATLPY